MNYRKLHLQIAKFDAYFMPMELTDVKRGSFLELNIVDVAFGGKGIAKIPTEKGDYILFIPNTFTGQKVMARLVKRKNRYAECKLVEVLKPSQQEVTQPYQPISGAPYINLPIATQKEFKQQSCIELFSRIGNLSHASDLFDQYIESPEVFHYRNKMEYSFSAIGYDIETKEEFDGFALGFKKRGTWWIVENLEKDSGLFDKEFEDKLKEIRLFLENTGLPAWHPPKKEGFFRYLVVRKSFKSGQLLIKLVTSDTGIGNFSFDAFTQFIQDLLGERLAGLLHTINNDIGDNAQSRHGHETVLAGKNSIEEELLSLNFEISMQSFFQTNPKCAELLYNKTIAYALEQNDDLKEGVVLDLFCGTGTIGQLIAAKTGAKVIGVDIVNDAIDNAKANAQRNNVENVSFFSADVNKFLLEYPTYKGKINTIILDPPRAGISGKALKRVIELKANRIVYVSCNPATQARDMEILFEAGYQLSKFSLVDQFPHTAHVESIAVFNL